jgi:hypothetical protein
LAQIQLSPPYSEYTMLINDYAKLIRHLEALLLAHDIPSKETRLLAHEIITEVENN